MVEVTKVEKSKGNILGKVKAPQMIHFDSFNDKKATEEVKDASLLPMSLGLTKNGFIKRKAGLA